MVRWERTLVSNGCGAGIRLESGSSTNLRDRAPGARHPGSGQAPARPTPDSRTSYSVYPDPIGIRMTPEYAIVLTTLPVTADAAGFARVLIDERLAACVSLLPPMESIYRWQDSVEREPERQILIKTS